MDTVHKKDTSGILQRQQGGIISYQSNIIFCFIQKINFNFEIKRCFCWMEIILLWI